MSGKTLMPISDGQVRLPEWAIGAGSGGGGARGAQYGYNPFTGEESPLPWNLFVWSYFNDNIIGPPSLATTSARYNGGTFGCQAQDPGTGTTGTLGIRLQGDIYLSYTTNGTRTYLLTAVIINSGGGLIFGSDIDTYVDGVPLDTHHSTGSEPAYTLSVPIPYIGIPVHVHIDVQCSVYGQAGFSHLSQIAAHLSS